jgi:26S proteasome regulatory subunit T5
VDEKPAEKYTDIGGLEKQLKELQEAVVLPITRKDLFTSIGIQPPKGVLLYGPPGMHEREIFVFRACACIMRYCFLSSRHDWIPLTFRNWQDADGACVCP